MNKFYKVSYEQFKEDMKEFNQPEEILERWYDEIKLPKRSTSGSAGYDFFAPFAIILEKGGSMIVPTGIRMEMERDKVLLCFPRSGLGFKFRMQLDNTVGVIDSDYFYSDNEGHIKLKISNDGYENKIIGVERGNAFAQGILMPFYLTDDDETDGVRNGGFGSTDK